MLATMIEESTVTVPAGIISDEVSHEIVQMLERVGPSVVQVKREGRGGGAGFVWRSDGAILTNYHVIAGSGSPSVQLQDVRSFPARVM
ncbi:MAG TPA: trypsin-like peptidase domain-containing protein [Chloroflexia bacterium]|nr:trypsin-like peptidase domain-containing protein [Chloroflexia bacterium]